MVRVKSNKIFIELFILFLFIVLFISFKLFYSYILIPNNKSIEIKDTNINNYIKQVDKCFKEDFLSIKDNIIYISANKEDAENNFNILKVYKDNSSINISVDKLWKDYNKTIRNEDNNLIYFQNEYIENLTLLLQNLTDLKSSDINEVKKNIKETYIKYINNKYNSNLEDFLEDSISIQNIFENDKFSIILKFDKLSYVIEINKK